MPPPPPDFTAALSLGDAPWTPDAAAAAARGVVAHLLYARAQAPYPLEIPSDASSDEKNVPPGPALRGREAAIARLEARAGAALAALAPPLFARGGRLLILFGPSVQRPIEAYDVAVAPATASEGGPPAAAAARAASRALLAAALPRGPATRRATGVHILVAAPAAAAPPGLAPRRGVAPALSRALRVFLSLAPGGRGGRQAVKEKAGAADDVIWWAAPALAGVAPTGAEGASRRPPPATPPADPP